MEFEAFLTELIFGRLLSNTIKCEHYHSESSGIGLIHYSDLRLSYTAEEDCIIHAVATV